MHEDRTQKIMAQKFTKNSSYITHPSSCHIIYSHVTPNVCSIIKLPHIMYSRVDMSLFNVYGLYGMTVTVSLKSGFFRF